MDILFITVRSSNHYNIFNFMSSSCAGQNMYVKIEPLFKHLLQGFCLLISLLCSVWPPAKYIQSMYNLSMQTNNLNQTCINRVHYLDK